MQKINMVKLEMRDVSCAKNDKDDKDGRVGCNRIMKIYRRIMERKSTDRMDCRCFWKGCEILLSLMVYLKIERVCHFGNLQNL